MFGAEMLPLALLLLFSATAPLAYSSSSFPVPAALPPHSWDTVGSKTFIHGCNADGLFNETGLELASKYSLLTVEKGQGLELPGYADDKMAALAAQWKAKRRALGLPEGWAMFYLNAKFDWTFYKLHAEMERNPSWPIQKYGAESGQPCTSRGDPTFPQPADGMLCFNHSKAVVRDAFVAACLNATKNAGFDGCFIDSASYARGPPYPGITAGSQATIAKGCNTTLSDIQMVGEGTIALLQQLQAAVGPSKLIIAKDSFSGGSEEYINTIMPADTFCSCYNCDARAGWSKIPIKQTKTYAGICQSQILEAIKLGKRGQVSLLHGEVNKQLLGNATALAEDFTFSLAAFLIAASDSAYFGYSDGWYYNGTRWHGEYDHPLGTPTGDAVQGSGAANMSWTRSFAAGTTVALDVLSHTATIHWG